MSSTNRSNARDFHIADYYVTPKDAIRKFMLDFIDDELFPVYGTNWMENIKILDPCAWGNPEKIFQVELQEWENYKDLKKNLGKVADVVLYDSFLESFKCIQSNKDM